MVRGDTALTIDIEIIIWHILAERNGRTSIISQVEDPSLDTKPIDVSMAARRYHLT